MDLRSYFVVRSNMYYNFSEENDVWMSASGIMFCANFLWEYTLFFSLVSLKRAWYLYRSIKHLYIYCMSNFSMYSCMCHSLPYWHPHWCLPVSMWCPIGDMFVWLSKFGVRWYWINISSTGPEVLSCRKQLQTFSKNRICCDIVVSVEEGMCYVMYTAVLLPIVSEHMFIAVFTYLSMSFVNNDAENWFLVMTLIMKSIVFTELAVKVDDFRPGRII